jgi:hypothetical protein
VGHEPKWRPEIGEKVDEVRMADMDSEEDARVEDDILRLRSSLGLRVDEAFIKQMADDYRAGGQQGGWWLTREENAEYHREEERRERVREAAQPYIEAHSAEFAGAWRGDGVRAEQHLAFTGDIAAHRQALDALVPEADVLHVHPARFSEDELRALSYRIADDDEDALRAEGIVVRETGANVVTNRVEVGIVTDAPERAAEVLRERYGDTVEIEYASPATHYADPVEWQCYELDSDSTSLTVWYWANPFIELDHSEVVEGAEEVRVTLFDRVPVGGVLLPATIRGVPVELAEPLGDRRVIDGMTGRVREPV